MPDRDPWRLVELVVVSAGTLEWATALGVHARCGDLAIVARQDPAEPAGALLAL